MMHQTLNLLTNPLKPKLDLKLNELIANLQNRGKHFRYTEVLAYSQLNLTQQPVPDPLWPLTQMKKNYYHPYTQLIFQAYLDQSFFALKPDSWGIGNRLINLANQPVWATYVVNNNWFWKQLKAIDSTNWLTALPGVKKVYVCGSSILEISHPNSDIDLAIECYKHQVLLARFWVKIALKLTDSDTHSLCEAWQQLLFKFGLVSQSTIAQIDQKIKPNKLDCGVFFEKQEQINEYFGPYERQLFILARGLIMQDYSDQKNWPTTVVNSLFFLKQSKFQQLYQIWLKLGLKLGLYLLSLPLLPLIFSQLLWYHLKKTTTDDHWLSHNFVAFYRRWF